MLPNKITVQGEHAFLVTVDLSQQNRDFVPWLKPKTGERYEGLKILGHRFGKSGVFARIVVIWWADSGTTYRGGRPWFHHGQKRCENGGRGINAGFRLVILRFLPIWGLEGVQRG